MLLKKDESNPIFLITSLKYIEQNNDIVHSHRNMEDVNEWGMSNSRNVIYIRKDLIPPSFFNGYSFMLECEKIENPKSKKQLSEEELKRVSKNTYYFGKEVLELSKIERDLNNTFADVALILDTQHENPKIQDDEQVTTIYTKRCLVALLGRTEAKDRKFDNKEGLAIIYLTEKITSKCIYVSICFEKDNVMTYGFSNGELTNPNKILSIIQHPLAKFHLKNDRRFY